jgi:glutathione S-transferase
MVTEHGLTLYHMAPSRSSTVLWLLEEIGQPYHVHALNMKKGENREPGYLAINPLGKVPALVHDGVERGRSAPIWPMPSGKRDFPCRSATHGGGLT